MKKYRCRKCSGTGSILQPPDNRYSEWTSVRCQACDGMGYLEIDESDEIKEGANE